MASSALVKAKEHLARVREHAAKLRGKGEEAVGEVVAAAEVVAGSTAGGFIDEKMGDVDAASGMKVYKVQGVPASLGLGLAAKAAAFFGFAGKHGKHVHDVGNGFLGNYGSVLGRTLAKKANTVK